MTHKQMESKRAAPSTCNNYPQVKPHGKTPYMAATSAAQFAGTWSARDDTTQDECSNTRQGYVPGPGHSRPWPIAPHKWRGKHAGLYKATAWGIWGTFQQGSRQATATAMHQAHEHTHATWERNAPGIAQGACLQHSYAPGSKHQRSMQMCDGQKRTHNTL